MSWRESIVTLRIAEDLEAYFEDLSIVDAIHQSAHTWSALDGVPELLVERGCFDEPGFQRGRSSNGIYLVHDWKLLPNALAVTITTFETETGRLVDSDVLVNANFAFSWLTADQPEEGRYDLPSVLTHELGHVLGLGDTRDVPDATMWPSIVPGDTYQRDLSPDDEAGATSIYPEDEPAARVGEGCGGASVLGRGTRGRAGRVLSSLSFLMFVVWLCTRVGSGRASRRHAIVLGGALLFGGLVPSSDVPPRTPTSAPSDALTRALPREHPVAARRLATFMQGAERLLEVRAKTRVERRAGMIWTRVAVHSPSGDRELEVRGGSLGGLTQLVSGRAPPRDGELLLVAWRKAGPLGWAKLRDGLIMEGTLEDGPPIAWE